MARSKKGKAKRERRIFSREFKVEAVRLMRERRELGVSMAQIGRELGVRPDLLRVWARKLEAATGSISGNGAPGKGAQESVEEELRRVRRENAVLR